MAKTSGITPKYNNEGNELKSSASFRIEATIWNKAMENANNEGFQLASLIRKFLIDFNKKNNNDGK